MKVHMIAIGGTGMAPLACLLSELGHLVVGSDAPLYPPMSDLLAAAGIVPMVGFDATHVEVAAGDAPDLVIVGNAVPRSNPEAMAAERAGIERISMPQAVARFLLAGRESLVVAGTHGKTTTTTMAATVLASCGEAPGYLVGGSPIGLAASFSLGGGPRFVIEGDEYNASYFDRGAKFLHYQPRYLVLTNIEYDHVDLYPTPQSFVAAFEKLVALVSPDGAIAVCGDDETAARVAAAASCRVIRYGLGRSNEVRAEQVNSSTAGTSFVVREALDFGAASRRQESLVRLAAFGEHNVLNALGVWSITRLLGYSAERVAAGLAAFRGVRRRLEPVGEGAGVVVVDDFAHHPTEVRGSLRALRLRYPGRRLVVFFEPRSLTAARADFFASYVEALAAADEVHLAPVFHAERLPAEQQLNTARVADELNSRGVSAIAHVVQDDLATAVDERLEQDRGLADPEVWVTMSSGSFGNLAGRLAARLQRESR